jgi:acylphosphatase
MQSVKIVVSGRVQGVGFRAFVAEEARRQGVSGWARNLADGRVEVLAHGAAPAVEAIIAACRTGPASAEVSGIETSEAEKPAMAGFMIRK